MFKSSSIGFDKLWNDSQMFFAMLRRQIIMLLIIQIIGFFTFILVIKPKGIGGETGLCIYKTYLQTAVMQSFDYTTELKCGDYAGNVTIRDFSNGGYYERFAKSCNNFLLNSFLFSCLIYCIIPIWMLVAHLRNKGDLKDKILRGVGMIEPKEVKYFIKKNPILFKGYMFKLTDDVWLPESIATRSSLTIGKPGSGKSQLIYRMIEQLRKQKFRNIIHDLKGDMISNFYNEGTDIIFNPVDKRMIRWSLFKELESVIDIQSFCGALISKEGNDPFWPKSSEILLRSILTLCQYRNETNYDSFWEYINTPNEILKKIFEETPGCKAGAKTLAEQKMASSVMAVLSTSVEALEYLNMTGLDRFEIAKEVAPEEMQDIEFYGFYRVNENLSYYKILVKNIKGEIVTEEYYQYYSMSEMFSIKEWIHGEGIFKDKQFIFLSNQVAVQEAVKPFLGMFVQFAVTALCSLPDYTAPKTFFTLDEFGQLPKMNGIKTLLTQGRSKNGAAWLLAQDFAQIKEIYGNEGASIIINNCGNLSFFSVNDEQTAQTLSKSIGSVEIERTDESRSMAVHDARDNFSQSKKIQEMALIIPKEVMDLPTLTFVIKMVDIPVTKDKFNFAKYEIIAESFIPNDIFLNPKSQKLLDAQSEAKVLLGEKRAETTEQHLSKSTSDFSKSVNNDIAEKLRANAEYNNQLYGNFENVEDDLPFGTDDEDDETDNTAVKFGDFV